MFTIDRCIVLRHVRSQMQHAVIFLSLLTDGSLLITTFHVRLEYRFCALCHPYEVDTLSTEYFLLVYLVDLKGFFYSEICEIHRVTGARDRLPDALSWYMYALQLVACGRSCMYMCIAVHVQ